MLIGAAVEARRSIASGEVPNLTQFDCSTSTGVVFGLDVAKDCFFDYGSGPLERPLRQHANGIADFQLYLYFSAFVLRKMRLSFLRGDVPRLR